MIVDKEKKGEIITQFRLRENDTGSVEVQVALLTERINRLTEHLKLYPHDRHSRHRLHSVIGRQRRFLAYLNRSDTKRYHSLITRLGLRK
ncbi:MAG: 30S ribosomal protein S15 [Dehalococcoidia bacterium]